MNFSLSMNSREVLFHLNYMGYKNVTAEQLKNFMIDLKKLVKYEKNNENNIMKSEVNIQAGSANVNIRRLFESQNTQLTKAKILDKDLKKSQKIVKVTVGQEEDDAESIYIGRCSNPSKKVIQTEISATHFEHDRADSESSCHRIFSADSHRMTRREKKKCDNRTLNINEKKQQNIDKENVPTLDLSRKSKGFIRPRSSSQTTKPKTKPRKKTDPVALYQNYQKDWSKFRSNICESSHSDLRWSIREKMMNNR